MNRIKVFLFIAIFIIITGTICTQDAPAKEDITQLIIGKWEIAPNKRALSGTIVFNENGNYVMNEKFHDGSGVSKEGEYKINCNVSPVTIDICLGECGRPGSEWTTLFGIIRVLPDNKLEICTSPDANYPPSFPEDKTSEYTMILKINKDTS